MVARFSDRLRRCEPPPSPSYFQGWTCLRGRLAQLCFRHTVPTRLAPG